MPIKFNFIPERQLGKDEKETTALTATIYNNGQLVFGRDYVRVYELDGKYVRLYADIEHRTVAWSVVEGKTDFDVLSDARQMKADMNGSYKFSIQRILTKMGWEKGMSIPNLEIKTYKSALIETPMFYVALPPKEATVTLNGEEIAPKKETKEK